MLKDFLPDGHGDSRGARFTGFVDRHIQVGLIQRKRLNEVGVFIENRADDLRVSSVLRKVRLEKHALRAAPVGLGARHGGVDAELPSHVVGGGDYGSGLGRSAHHHGLIAQFGAFQQFYRRVEHVHVHVDDLSRLPRIRHVDAQFCHIFLKRVSCLNRRSLFRFV